MLRKISLVSGKYRLVKYISCIPKQGSSNRVPGTYSIGKFSEDAGNATRKSCKNLKLHLHRIFSECSFTNVVETDAFFWSLLHYVKPRRINLLIFNLGWKGKIFLRKTTKTHSWLHDKLLSEPALHFPRVVPQVTDPMAKLESFWGWPIFVKKQFSMA